MRFGENKNSGEPSLYQRDVAPFTLLAPSATRVPFVFNSPHSGRIYKPDFLSASRLDPLRLRYSEDFMVDELFGAAPRLGAPLLSANFPRAWLDVNREPFELDPAMFDGPLPHYANIASSRVVGGLGTIARIVTENEEIYKDLMPIDEALLRIETHYRPYHTKLSALISQAVSQFGHAVLVDCHSMPSTVDATKRGRVSRRADFIIGDRFGSSCSLAIRQAAIEFLTDLGYEVTANKPYAGGYITEHYGRPQNGLHAIQIEINRGLYMDEARMVKKPGFDRLAADLKIFISRLVSIPDHALGAAGQPLAAE